MLAQPRKGVKEEHRPEGHNSRLDPILRKEANVRHPSEDLVDRFEKGALSRRELIAGLMALGASASVTGSDAAPPKPIAVGGIDHVAFRVSDVGRSARFYAEHLGASVRSQSPSSVFLDVGADWIALFGAGTVSTGFPPTASGVDHVSFHSTAARSIEDRVRVLREHGLDPHNPAGSGRVYFKDPDGIILQLS
jgi:catechol 2,3-dioxygenase-like lactoylglutathione lyase family enzyme